MEKRKDNQIIEPETYNFLKKLIEKAETADEVLKIAKLGTTYKRTGFHFSPQLEKTTDTISYFKKNTDLSFSQDKDGITHKLIIGDNYKALLNLLIQYRGKIDVIYIDPPYAKDKMGEFAKTNYNNNITRDHLLSMLYPRLLLARQLLSETGVIFCSIDDKNQAYVKCLFDDIFEESGFLLNIPRITKKGGKSTQTIMKNNDYVIAYTLSNDIKFSQEDKDDLSKYKYEDEHIKERGKYALTQTLDYNSLQYSTTMDYEIELNGRKFYPGGTKEGMLSRHKGNHGTTDWVWRWSKSAVEWGIKNDMFVIKNDRIYTKSYLNVKKKNGKNELENIDAKKAYTTLSFIDNKYSNDNAKKEFDSIFNNGSTLFKNPKPTSLISELIKMVASNNNSIVLDFFAGSGTTGQAVLELNKDGGNRQYICVQLNEITDTTPNGIVYDVTSKRLKRVMTGKCYDGSSDFEWIKKHEALGGNLDVYNIAEVANFETTAGKTPFDVIDETLYGKEKFSSIQEKIEWVCSNFEHTQKRLEGK